MDFGIPIPKLLVIAQKRSGSHFLQDCISCAALTGTTFIQHLEAGNTASPLDKSIYRVKNNGDMRTTQFLRYHNFGTQDRNLIVWQYFSRRLIQHTPKIVVLGRKDKFHHALSDWYNDHVFNRDVKRNESHADWTDYRERLIASSSVNPPVFESYYIKAIVYFQLFASLYYGHEDKCRFIYYEDLHNTATVVKRISEWAGFDVSPGDKYPEWKQADYSKMGGYKEIKKVYG